MAEEDLDVASQMFLIENVAIANMLVEEVMIDLEHMSTDKVHAKLLDHVYTAHEDNGVTITAFQNLAATAVLLLAIEREKSK